MSERRGRRFLWLVAAPLTIAAGAALADAHWTSGNVNAVNRLLGARSGWQFDYVPPPDPEQGLLGTLDRYPGLDQSIAISTVPPPDADLPPPDADRQVHVLVPGDATTATRISWQQPPEPDLPPGPGIDLAFPPDVPGSALISMVPPVDPDHPPDPGHPLMIAYPPDPGAPIDIVIPAGANVVFHDENGDALRLCGGAIDVPPVGR